MRKYAAGIAVIAAIAGGAGFLLRRAELRTAFEAVSGLSIRGARTTTVLVAYSAFVLVCALVTAFVLRRKYAAPPTFRAAFAPASLGFLTLAGLVFLALLASGALLFMSARGENGGFDRNTLILTGLCILTAVSLLALSYMAYARRDSAAGLFFSLVPELFFTFWLALLYQQNQTNPALLAFSPRVLAVAASGMSFYSIAGYLFGRPTPAGTVFFHAIAVYCCAVTLADPRPLWEKIVFAAMALYLLVNLVRFVQNLTPKAAQLTVDS